MRKRRCTSNESSRVTAGTCKSKIAGGLALALLCCPAFAHAQNHPGLSDVLAQRRAALATLHLRAPQTVELGGALTGSGLSGRFETLQSGENVRDEEQIGARLQSSFTIDGRHYLVDENGAVRELRGVLLARERTLDFIEAGGFVDRPRYDAYAGEQRLPDGRATYALKVTPPDGQPVWVYVDKDTLMLDRVAYDDADGTVTQDYSDYRVAGGFMFAARTVESNGDHAFDLTRSTDVVAVDRPIPRSTFDLPVSTQIHADKPVTVPIIEQSGHDYVRVQIHGRTYLFLLDSGSQAIVLDTRAAADLGLHAEGRLEVAGAQRSSGLGVAALDGIDIGGAHLPMRVVTVLNLGGVAGAYTMDGILGYSFFAAAEVRIDPDAGTMTFAKPGALPSTGNAFSVDSDRQLVEVAARINGIDGRFVIDTGDSNELLVYSPFAQQHPWLIDPAHRTYAQNVGVGGSARAVTAIIDELDFGPYRLYNRYADVMQTTQGAFADRFDAGNIGMGVLRNFVLTFDLANTRLYARPGAHFDDGRFRTL